ncbi:MAG: DUF2267 domain-containing protein [Hydrogenothermaceae bacterium]|nr:DUF2267 domain-containing protein [Hydrogenothermaceae bacterium]
MNFEKYVEKGNLFLKELAQEIGVPDDRDRAGRILRTVLHVLRDRLTLEESFDLISQLPMCIKAIYVDGWKPKPVPDKSIKSVEDFVQAVLEHDARAAGKDFGNEEHALQMIKAVFRVIKRHVSDGEFQDIKGDLPKHLKPLLD